MESAAPDTVDATAATDDRNGEKSPPSSAEQAVVEEEAAVVTKHKLEELAAGPDTANGDQHATKTNGVHSHEQEFDGSNSKEDDANDAAETPAAATAVGNGDDLNGVQSDFELSQICENGGNHHEKANDDGASAAVAAAAAAAESHKQSFMTPKVAEFMPLQPQQHQQ